MSQGNLPEAQRLFGESLQIRQRLSDSDPGNAAWQRDLAVSHHTLAMLAEQKGEHLELMTERRACFKVLDGMRQRNLHFDPQMEQVYQQLSKLSKSDLI